MILIARYLKYVIKQNDTIQGIAEKATGDYSNYEQIIEYNDLRYPFIVDTPQEKLADVEHLVTIGDKIILPFPLDNISYSTDSMPRKDESRIVDMALGTDVALSTQEVISGNWGSWNGIFELADNGKGDIGTNTGIDNLKQAINTRLLTEKGSLVMHPTYGTSLADDFGLPVQDVSPVINNDISQAILTDPRVTSCSCTDYKIKDNEYTSNWKIEVESLQAIYDWAISRDSTGNFTID